MKTLTNALTPCSLLHLLNIHQNIYLQILNQVSFIQNSLLQKKLKKLKVTSGPNIKMEREINSMNPASLLYYL